MVYLKPVELALPRHMAELTLKAHFPRAARARLWLASRLMLLVGWIAGCGVVVEVEVEVEGVVRQPHGRSANGVPLRYDVDAPNYDPDLGWRLRVFLDGVEMSNVTSYDIEAGFVRRFRGLEYEQITGVVTVTMVDTPVA